MAPFAVWSGKMLDDMGFPISCLKNPSNAFWEVEVGVTSDEWPSLTMYYGLCFTAICNAENLNQNAGAPLPTQAFSSTHLSKIPRRLTTKSRMFNSQKFRWSLRSQQDL